MKRLTSREIRKMWIDYFTKNGHKVVESASLIPVNDDTLLWVNAGVTPLKSYFDGTEVPVSKRITNIQKCIRTNDIENVGVTRRHHTFFEMMGNFSIGDYFRDEAITFAFNLLTGKEWFDIPVEKLYVTVFPDDKDTINKWISLGFIPDHIIPLEGNFWEIGPGPCGPDTEIFFDRGEKYDPDGDALEKFKNDENNERYVEIWNNVFSQFNSEVGKERKDYKELPSKNIDTGAGIERWACIFQDVDSNFDTDLFLPTINQIENISGVMYDGSMPFKVIADHIRALTFALSDGATFGNSGRGYILRRLLRRSVRYGRKLGLEGLFIYKLVDSVVNNYKEFYPYLSDKQAHVKALIMQEEQLFNKTLISGEKRVYELMDESLDNTVSGYDVFKLYDTYGFPYELTLEYLEERGFTTNKEEFDKYMQLQKQQSKSNVHHETMMNGQNEFLLKLNVKSEFIYDKYKIKSKAITLIEDNTVVDKINKEGIVIFDKTVFYATSGGQEFDTGMITGNGFKAKVVEVMKAPNGQHLHKIQVLQGVLKTDDTCELVLDEEKRKATERNHSSVHLLQYSLRKLISMEIAQAGSRVDNNTLRFDFTYTGKIDDKQLIDVEANVNKIIKEGIKRETKITKLSEIDKSQVMALFSDKYHEDVRLVEFGKSKELCGGTHVNNTKDINSFAILTFANKGANTYRIEAATNTNIKPNMELIVKPFIDEANNLMIKAKSIIQEAKNSNIKLNYNDEFNIPEFKSYKDIVDFRSNLNLLQESVKNLEKEYTKLKEEKMVNELSNLEGDIVSKENHNYLIKKLINQDTNSLKQVLDNLVNKYENLFVLILNYNGENINFLARSNTNINAGIVVKDISQKCMGNGGGSNKFAQGGGKDLKIVDTVIQDILDGKYND